MRKTLKFFHTLASCGLIGAFLGYMVLLAHAPQDTPQRYADVRYTIDMLCDFVLLPSLAVALFTGLIAMAVHRPFMELRWVWIKAALGLLMFEATLGVIQSKADYAAKLSAKIAAGEESPAALASALATEWNTLLALMALSLANIVLGVWRPPLKRRAVSNESRRSA